jgi:hypothetical protein
MRDALGVDRAAIFQRLQGFRGGQHSAHDRKGGERCVVERCGRVRLELLACWKNEAGEKEKRHEALTTAGKEEGLCSVTLYIKARQVGDK